MPPPYKQLVAAGVMAAAGASGMFGFAPYGWYGLPILGLALLFFVWRRFPTSALWLTFVYALFWFGVGVSWLYAALHDHGEVATLPSLLLIVVFSAFLALFPLSAAWLARRFSIQSPAGLAALWTMQEWLRSWMLTGFPWLVVGYSQIPASVLAGYTPVFGVFGVSFVLAWLAGILARPDARGVMAALLLCAIGAGLGRVDWVHPVAEPLSVSLLQGNIDQSIKWRPEALSDTLLTYERLVVASKSRLIILPETAIPLLYDDVPPLYLQTLADSAREHGADLLIGMPEQEPDGRYYNSVMSFGVAPTQIYRKYHLVPFGEYVPMRALFGQALAVLHAPMADFSRGTDKPAPLRIAGQQLGVDICYEDVFGDEIRRPLPRATMLVNVTDDAWFGHTAAPWQHVQMAQTRALETGRYLLRATNTGVTAIIDQRGRLQAVAPLFVCTSLNGEARAYRGETPFVRFGDTPILLLVFGLVLYEMAGCKNRSVNRSR